MKIADTSSRLRLLQLASQAFPTGAFAYSGGLESALHWGLAQTPEEATDLLDSLLRNSVAQVELPYFLRMFNAYEDEDEPLALRWSALLLASRESSELQAQDAQMARAIRRILAELWRHDFPSGWYPRTFAEGLARSCVYYGIGQQDAALLCVYTWIDQHATALSRLFPLGPVAGQRVVDALLRTVPEVVDHATALPDTEIGMNCPHFAITSAMHEAQYSRIFRS